MITKEEIEVLFSYNKENGVLTRIKNGKIAGCIDSTTKYVRVKINGKRYQAHKLVWMLHNSASPICDIDHINRVRSDNRIENLRLATRAENCRNTKIRTNNNTGTTGVCFKKGKNKYEVNINVDKKQIFIGAYSSKEAAVSARREAELKYW